MTTSPVLIVGAGPTGLVLALSLMKRGIRPRIIDQRSGPGQASRAMVVQARVLELYDQFGIADEIVKEGVRVEEAHVFARGHEVVSFGFQDAGGDIGPYPFVLAYAQDDHERFLVGKLEELGLQVEWNKSLQTFTHDDSGVHAQISGETAHFDYICGCDGAHSRVRETLGMGFPGGTYSQMFFVADVKTDRPLTHDFDVVFGKKIFGVMLPVRLTGMRRLIGVIPPDVLRDEMSFEDVRDRYEKLLNIKVLEVNWFSKYHVHHRVAEHFTVGRCFLLGDAAHIHSPAGGQGMNTGIGDAINLGWKLAQVLKGEISAKVLKSYEEERIAFAKTLVSTTDRGFRLVAGREPSNQFFRLFFAPNLLKALWKIESVRHLLFTIVSQIHIEYREDLLSQGHAGKLHGGDRLPWVSAVNNFEALKTANWQVQIFGEKQDDFERMCERLSFPLHVFPWSEEAGRKGFRRNAAYLVRPDGYLGLVTPKQDPDALISYAERFGLKCNPEDVMSLARTPASRNSLLL